MNVQQYFRVPKVVAPSGLPYTPPLDVYNNCLAAYSVRKLRTAYAGPCMRINGDSETSRRVDIFFDSNGLIDTAAIAAYGNGTATLVDVWYDQSGNGNHLYSNDGNRPVIAISNVVRMLNSKPSVTQESFASTTPSSMQLRLSSKIQIASFFGVNRQHALPFANYVFHSGADNDGVLLGGSFGGINGLGLVLNDAIAGQNTNEDFNQKLISLFGGSSKKLYMNGGTEVSLTMSRNPFFYEYGRTILNGSGANLTNHGNGQELLFFSDDKIADKAGIEGNINSYFSIY